MLRMPYRVLISLLSSTSSLPMLTLPAYNSANSSTTGAIILQGPHHSAQKSTIKGSAAFSHSSKFESVSTNAICRFFSVQVIKAVVCQRPVKNTNNIWAVVARNEFSTRQMASPPGNRSVFGWDLCVCFLKTDQYVWVDLPRNLLRSPADSFYLDTPWSPPGGR